MKSKLVFNGSDEYEKCNEWRILMLIDWCETSRWKLHFSLFVFDATGFIANTCAISTENNLTIKMTRMFFQAVQVRACRPFCTLSFKNCFCSSQPLLNLLLPFWLIHVTALLVDLLFRCLAFSAVALPSSTKLRLFRCYWLLLDSNATGMALCAN